MKILASDLDGTIIRDKKISTTDYYYIKKFFEENIFIIATGRDYVSFKNAVDRYNLFFNYAVLCNGGVVITKNNIVIFSNNISNNIVRNILTVLLEFDNFNTIILSKTKSTLIFNSYEEMRDFLKYMCFENDIVSITIELEKDIESSTKRIYEYMSPYTDYIEILKNGLYIDIVAKNADKSNAIRWIINNYIEGYDEIITIGDGGNDIGMLKITQNSFTFYCSDIEIKNVANNLVNNISECIIKYL